MTRQPVDAELRMLRGHFAIGTNKGGEVDASPPSLLGNHPPDLRRYAYIICYLLRMEVLPVFSS